MRCFSRPQLNTSMPVAFARRNRNRKCTRPCTSFFHRFGANLGYALFIGCRRLRSGEPSAFRCGLSVVTEVADLAASNSDFSEEPATSTLQARQSYSATAGKQKKRDAPLVPHACVRHLLMMIRSSVGFREIHRHRFARS